MYRQQNMILHVLPPKRNPKHLPCSHPPGCGAFFCRFVGLEAGSFIARAYKRLRKVVKYRQGEQITVCLLSNIAP
jgi:hypothetical protein